MHFDDRRTPFLQDRLQRRLKECRLDSFYSYYRLLISQEGKKELSHLLENLTVNETSFSEQGAVGAVSERCAGRSSAAQAGAPGLRREDLERGLLDRTGTLHAGHAGGRCAVVLLSAESAALRIAASQAAGAAPVAGGDSGQRHQLFGVADCAGGILQREPDGDWSTMATACATSTKWANATPSRKPSRKWCTSTFTI